MNKHANIKKTRTRKTGGLPSTSTKKALSRPPLVVIICAVILFATTPTLALAQYAQYFSYVYDTTAPVPILHVDGAMTPTLTQNGDLSYTISGISSTNNSEEVSLEFNFNPFFGNTIPSGTVFTIDYSITNVTGSCGYGIGTGNTLQSSETITSVDIPRNTAQFTSTSVITASQFGFILEYGSGSCTNADLTIYSITTPPNTLFSNTQPEVFTPEDLTLPEFLSSIGAAIIQFPESVNFQTDAINFSMGMMIFLMAINTWFVIIRRNNSVT